MEIKHDIHTQNKHVSISGNDGPTVRIYHGPLEICKTESDALEAAELLKAFFEAKAAGKVARLFVNEGELHGWQDSALNYPKPEGPTVTKMDTQEAKALLDRLPDLIWNRATDRAADTTKLEYARILIGQWAATIQAQNIALAPDDCFERAFEIWTSSQLVDAKRLLP